MTEEFVKLVWNSPTQGIKEVVHSKTKAMALMAAMPSAVNAYIVPLEIAPMVQ